MSERYEPAPLPEDLEQMLKQRANEKGFRGVIREILLPFWGYTNYTGSVEGLPKPFLVESERDKALIALDDTISTLQLWARRLLGESEKPFPEGSELVQAMGLPEDARFDLAHAIIDTIPLEELTAEVMEEEDDSTRYKPERNPIKTFDKLRSLVDGRVKEEDLTARYLFEAIADIYAVHSRINEMNPENRPLVDDLRLYSEGCDAWIRHYVPPNDADTELAAILFYDGGHRLENDQLILNRTSEGSIDTTIYNYDNRTAKPITLTPTRIKEVAQLLLEGYISTPPEELQRTF